MLAVSANLIELMGGVPICNSQMALAISTSPRDPDRGPGGGEKDSPWAECCGSEGRSEHPSELIDWIRGAK